MLVIKVNTRAERCRIHKDICLFSRSTLPSRNKSSLHGSFLSPEPVPGLLPTETRLLHLKLAESDSLRAYSCVVGFFSRILYFCGWFALAVFHSGVVVPVRLFIPLLWNTVRLPSCLPLSNVLRNILVRTSYTSYTYEWIPWVCHCNKLAGLQAQRWQWVQPKGFPKCFFTNQQGHGRSVALHNHPSGDKSGACLLCFVLFRFLTIPGAVR